MFVDSDTCNPVDSNTEPLIANGEPNHWLKVLSKCSLPKIYGVYKYRAAVGPLLIVTEVPSLRVSVPS